MNELALFAGAGGGLLGGKLMGWRTVCYVERNAYCLRVLQARIRDGLLDDAPIWDDIKTFDGQPWTGSVDIITAGFPCQPFSTAGYMRAGMDERNLWPETIRVIKEVRPQWCLLENVAGLLAGRHGYFGQILRDLAESGFDARWDCIPASAVGAPHHRNRLWILAHAAVADAHQALEARSGSPAGGELLQVPPDHGSDLRGGLPRADAWFASEPGMARIDHGVAHRMDRVRAIGNGQVPAVVRAAWHTLTSPPGSVQVEIRERI